MKRVTRRYIVTAIKDRLDEVICKPDDDMLANLYEILTLDECTPQDRGEFVVE